MDLAVNVILPSGRREIVSLAPTARVETLIMVAQVSLGQRFLRLVTSKGRLLSDPLETIQSAGLHDGDSVTAVAQQARLAATQKAFAAIRVDGRVVAWGDPASGGDCSRVKTELTNVHQIQSTEAAFAAILAGGRVVTWGNTASGGNCSGVQHLLTDVRQIQSTRELLSWEMEESLRGGDCSAIHSQLVNVTQIQSAKAAFAAIRPDGRVVTWGNAASGGNCSGVQHLLLEMCGKFNRQETPSLLSWKMEELLHGAILPAVETPAGLRIN